MTIIEAIKEVLQNVETGLTSKAIYNAIIEQQLYSFGAQNPLGVVNGEIRRHCIDLNFPTASPAKYFCISGKQGNKLLFSLLKKGANCNHESVSVSAINTKERLPEEVILESYRAHLLQVEENLLGRMLESHPSFFEQLVVDLLLKMGYGYDQKSGYVVGKSHDNGIDGIINQDNLGLDLIYIQAKRYDDSNSVGRKEIQAFVGAMSNVQKGVFITTSQYTKEAKDYAQSQQQKNLKLIDGKQLTEYMIKFGVGVECVRAFNIYKLDDDYFGN